MKHFTKQLHAILYSMHDLLWVVIGLFLLLGVILIASSDSWLYLFLVVPFLIYLYQSKVSRFMKNKNFDLEHQMKRLTEQIRAIAHNKHNQLSAAVGQFIKYKKPVVERQMKRFVEQIHTIINNVQNQLKVLFGRFLKTNKPVVELQMKRFTEQIHNISDSMHDLIWVVIGLFMLLGVILIASSDSWRYLFLLVPFLVYLYHSKGIKLLKNKNSNTRKKS